MVQQSLVDETVVFIKQDRQHYYTLAFEFLIFLKIQNSHLQQLLHLTLEKEYYHMRLSRAKRVVEYAFGILTAKFRILWKLIQTSSDFADKIIKCICFSIQYNN